MNQNDKIYIAGHRGMVGSAIARELKRLGFNNIIEQNHDKLDLCNQAAVDCFFSKESPDYVFMSAAKVGGIIANMSSQASFLMENLQMECNVINSAYRYNVKKLIFLGSSCIYPKSAQQPISEKALLTGILEPTNEGYALAKIIGLKLCEYYRKEYGADFVSIMPCNLYGYNDNFNLMNSHLIPALIRKFHEAKSNNSDDVIVWGTGNVYRELLFADDLAKACVFVMKNYSGSEFLNIGYGEDYTVAEIAQMVKYASGFKGRIIFDTSKPDGIFRKIVDSSKIRELGWRPEVSITEGISLTYDWYCKNFENGLRK